jgi:hypothetical protein
MYFSPFYNYVVIHSFIHIFNEIFSNEMSTINMKNIIQTIQKFIRYSAVALFAATTLLALQPVLASAQTVSDSSMNWSGYVATPSAASGTFTGITATWTIPTVANSYLLTADATWIGIGGVSGNDLIQAGTQEITGQGSTTEYEAWVETLPNASQPVSLSVKAGDSVMVSITQQSTNLWLTKIMDITTGQSYSTTTAYTSSLSSAEWIEEAPMSGNSLVPLDNFGSVEFTNATAIENGQNVTLAGSGATAMNMLNGYGQVLATPSAVGSDGQSFTVTKSATASNIPGGTTRIFNPRGTHGVQGFTGRTGRGYQSNPASSIGTTSTTTTTTAPTGSQSPSSIFPYGFGGFGRQHVSIQQEIQQLEAQAQTATEVSGWQKEYTVQIPGGMYTIYVK